MLLISEQQSPASARLSAPYSVLKAVAVLCACLSLITASFAEPSEISRRFPKPLTYVTDGALLLSVPVVLQLEAKLKAFDKSEKGQIIVYITDTRGTEGLEALTLKLANDWGVGYAGKDNGVVLFIFRLDHVMRLEVGRGLEKTLTDERAKRIIDATLVPAFSKHDFDGGVMRAVDDVISVLTASAQTTR